MEVEKKFKESREKRRDVGVGGRIRIKVRRWGCVCRVLRILGGRGRLMLVEGLGSKRVIWGGVFRLVIRGGI